MSLLWIYRRLLLGKMRGGCQMTDDITPEEEKFFVGEAMVKFGGSFVHQLGVMIRQADATNLQKIKKTWPEYWKEYLKKGMAEYEKGRL
jgi:hypothetical protein